MITGRLYVDLTVEPATDLSRDRRKLSVLDGCPDGTKVTVDIGRRRFASPDAAWWLHRHEERLEIEILGEDRDAIARFVRAGRAGHLAVVA